MRRDAVAQAFAHTVEQVAVAAVGIDRVDGIGKLRRLADAVELTVVEIGLRDAATEVTGAADREHIAERDRAERDRHARRAQMRESGLQAGLESRTPIHMD